MNEYGEGAPAYLTFRVMPQQGPIAAFAEEEALRARERYPELMGMGTTPTFHYTRESDLGGWEILDTGGFTPQDARDGLGSHFRQMASQAQGKKRVRALMAAVDKLDWVAVDEMRVLGRRYRIVRGEQFIRMGPDGPEPPRPSDPDPARGAPGDSLTPPSRTQGFLIDPYTGTGLSDGLLRFDLANFVITPSAVSEEVFRDARLARHTHPGTVLLPAEFAIAEKEGGRWRSYLGACPTPQSARATLSTHFRVFKPAMEDLTEEEEQAYARAADRLDDERGMGVTVLGRRFRVIRVEQVVRIGPDGPEPPRPSDHDPEPPPSAHVKQLKDEGLWQEPEDLPPLELSPRHERMMALLEEDRARRKARAEAYESRMQALRERNRKGGDLPAE
ncbi:DUF5954 family protein [Streptomyces yaizuensis]|uniref:DUF5954 family protein n=1 Tax=Streptomyces yaizuensis TaxID=2989713 RepID=A0ABQ5P509_9ACTN|nr:DUF5954 family protein [Streptomyces sp. YSPA8]GLF97676.1 DUF5954 family protein [Streptomyces sp. YSPA8]